MRRLISIAVVGVWGVLLGVLVMRTAGPGRSAPAPPPPAAALPARDQWLAILQHGQTVGYSHARLTPSTDGYTFAEESLLRATVLGVPQTIRTRMDGSCDASFALREVDFALDGGAAPFRARAVVHGAVLRLTLWLGGEQSDQALPLHGPLYLPWAVRAAVGAAPMREGGEWQASVFDPLVMRAEPTHVAVVRHEQVPDAAPGVLGWRVEEEFHGMKSTAWIDPSAGVLREEGPMGLVLVRRTRDEVMRAAQTEGAALDVVATVAVPVARPIDDARGRCTLKVQVSGVAPDVFPVDEEQTRAGSVVTVTRREVQAGGSYRLPYAQADRASDLVATPFLQSDHPRIRSLAQDILAGEDDALRATRRLADWVYREIRKTPRATVPNALQVLEMREGDCNEHAMLLAALARAAGVPTRVVAGLVYLDGAFLYHAWCEVWLGRWVSVDPTFGQMPADATHLKLLVGGPEQYMGLANVVGRLQLEVLADAG